MSEIEVEARMRRLSTDEKQLATWIERYRAGLRPYAGAWRDEVEIKRLHRRAHWRSSWVLIEVLCLVAILYGLVALLYLVMKEVL